jgi:transcriptional regulator with XRE-family HTH domain
MGSSSRARPEHLCSKLRQIREALGLSQTEMGKLLGLDSEFARNYVSGYERNTREPTLEVLLRYSEISRVWVNSIIDDNVDIPKKLPCSRMQEGLRLSSISHGKRKR